jgi:hypothetical protein
MGENYLKVPELREPLIPLSVLELDLAPSTAGWAADLAARGFSVELDDVGRLAVSREVARQLTAEKRESEQKARDAAVARDAEFERQRQATLPRGIPWYQIAPGQTPAEALIAAGGGDDRPRRRSVIVALRELADGHDEVLAEAAGITAGSWFAWPSTHMGYELVAAGMMIMAGGHDSKPFDFEALERWTRVGYERGMRSRKGER